ncbi:MAG TPA: hypothetical protein VNM16_09220 [Bacillota bacterium]|nr:hypothetical protein [Bacillota bacterium]
MPAGTTTTHPARRTAMPEPPAALADTPAGWELTPFDAAESAFRALTTGPRPLALHGTATAPDLPARLVPLGEIRDLLLHPATTAAARNRVWAELIRRARTCGPAWVVGLTGVALPGLRRATAKITPAYTGELGDLQAEVLAGFLAAMRALDTCDLDVVPLASRLCWAGYRAGLAHASANARHAMGRRPLPEGYATPPPPWGHPDFVLAAAVRRGVLTQADADLIGRNRLERVPLARLAAERGISLSALAQHRQVVEAVLVKAIRDGDLSTA